jgi:dimethylargininase
MFTKAIVRPPSENFAQGLKSNSLGPPNVELARRQFAAYCKTLTSCGLEVQELQCDERYPDSTFIEDVAVLTEHAAILTRPGAMSRRGEVDSLRTILAAHFKLEEISEPGTLEGGDVCRVDDHFFIGISQRTNPEGAGQLADYLKAFGYTSTLIDIRSLDRCLHLKSGIGYLGQRRLVVAEPLLNLRLFDSLSVIPLPAAEAYAANCLNLNDTVVIAAGFSSLERQLATSGISPIALELTEFEKMDGGLSCLSLRF